MISQLQSGMHRRIRREMISQYRKGTEINMINFEEELKNFKPSLEVEEAEQAIYNHELTDMTDVMQEMLQELKQQNR
jgi:hypothetical protein